MRVLVTGREGQVARSLKERGLEAGHEVVTLGRPILDLAGSPQSIVAAILAERPEAIISAAAYTAVDLAESEPELAFAINAKGPAAIAQAARALSVPLIHLSTDYVFDGSKPSPYTEEDSTGPTSVYGCTKLDGEKAVISEHRNSIVLRTSWVYSPFGTNFVKTMLRLGAEHEQVRVVADQYGTPTSAFDIADAILSIVSELQLDSDRSRRGIFHLAGSGEASWAEFAKEIFATSAEMGGPSAKVKAITTKEYPTLAKRPANSRLDSGRLERIHGVKLPGWRDSLRDVMRRLVTAS